MMTACGIRTKQAMKVMSGYDPLSILLEYMLMWQIPVRLKPSKALVTIAANVNTAGTILEIDSRLE